MSTKQLGEASARLHSAGATSSHWRVTAQCSLQLAVTHLLAWQIIFDQTMHSLHQPVKIIMCIGEAQACMCLKLATKQPIGAPEESADRCKPEEADCGCC